MPFACLLPVMSFQTFDRVACDSGEIIAVPRYVAPCLDLSCRMRRLLPAECSTLPIYSKDALGRRWGSRRRFGSALIARSRGTESGHGMPCPDSDGAGSAWQRRNPAPQRSRSDAVMPLPGAPARRRVGIASGSADGAAAGCTARLDAHPLGRDPGTSARSKPRRGFHALREGFSPHRSPRPDLRCGGLMHFKHYRSSPEAGVSCNTADPDKDQCI
jgi:hypothetical protein